LVYYQVQDLISNDEVKDANADPNLFLTYGDHEKQKDKAIYFLRKLEGNKKQVNLQESNDNEVTFGELLPGPHILTQLNHMMENVYHPMIERMGNDDWGECEEESRNDFHIATKKFGTDLSDSIKSMTPGQDVFQLDPDIMARFTSSAQEAERTNYYEREFKAWINKINGYLNEDSDKSGGNSNDAGPRVELEYWKTRMQNITNWSEQLKSKDFQMVRAHLFKQRQHVRIFNLNSLLKKK
jgi:dynein heavy chain, axonemal